MTVLGFLSRRLSAAVLILLILSLVIFLLQHVSPGDPARAYVGANASPETVAAQRQALGLDDPLPTQFFRFLGGLFTGDLGRSLRTRQPVTADLATYLPATVELVVTAFLLALVLAALYALSGALRWRGGSVGRGVLLLLATAPPFLLALVGIIVFFGQLGWLPNRGVGDFQDPGPFGMQALDTLLHGQTDAYLDALRHLVLPATVLAIAPAVAIGRVLRSSLQSVLDVDYVRTARAKGLRESRVVLTHVLRNAIGPALSMGGLQLGVMFAGVVVVEQVFSWPGIGNYLAASIPVADFPAIAGVTLVLGAIYVLSNVAVDLLQAVADPRIAAE
ncbi:ABC transporter permease [Mycolicibacterium sp. 018/SC-01/001]|uniref:ABC transporter permease n=1 Tax=Mycolicibacterium sp. 018/SC-01/001 TaxID=2592069 RepID=UPI0021028B24|nr:ABC transporter permease [Mycolicibacterium sp. 018/SC-01/001]